MNIDEEIVVKKNDGKIFGTGILSCLNQLELLGENKNNIFRKLHLKKIDLKKKYSYKIRSLIIEEVRKLYGDLGVYSLGIGQADNYNVPEHIKLENFINRNKQKYLTKKISITELLETSLLRYNGFIDLITRSFNFNKEKVLTSQMFKISDYVFKHIQEASHLKKHHVFIHAMHKEMILRHFSDIFDFEIKFINEESKDSFYGATFVYLYTFKKNIKRKDPRLISEIHRHDTTKKFLDLVLKKSESKSKQLIEISSQLSKYIPPQIHDALFAGKYDTEIKTQRRKLTVFFSDIKNFTSTSENLQPEDLTKYLNEYFSEMTKIALNHGATIDKYIGDAMMVFFGDPDTKGEREDARACVEMALKMQERMVGLREKWLHEGFADPFEVRIGINTGYCNVGNFGSDQRLTYTIIGGEVNVAARLESAAEANGILMSYETYAHVQDMVEVEQKEAIKMKGINREIKIYAVEGRKEVVKTKAKPIRSKKPTKKELTEIEKLKEELRLVKLRLKKVEGVSK